MKQKYKIGGYQFSSKEDITELCRKILYSYRIGERLPKKHIEFLGDLVKHHPNYTVKVGSGIEYIRISEAISPLLKRTRHFEIVRIDLSTIDFSFVECIKHLNSKNTINNSKVLLAFRYEIAQFIRDYKEKEFESRKYIKCPLCGLPTSKKNAEVDHISPLTFNQLLFDFLKSNNLILSNIQVVNANKGIVYIKDRSIAANWYKFHEQNALIRVVFSTANKAEKKLKVDFSLLESNTPSPDLAQMAQT